MKFSTVLVIAFILAVLAIVDKKFGSGIVFAILLLLLLGTVAPFIAIPLGVIAIVWLLYTDKAISDWIGSFKKGQ